jgi:uncharacterized membrane protein
MSDPLDAILNEMLSAPMIYIADDGFSHAVIARIAEMQFRRSRFISAALATVACMLFALVSAMALRAQVTSQAAAVLLPVALSLAIGTLILSRSVQQLFQD